MATVAPSPKYSLGRYCHRATADPAETTAAIAAAFSTPMTLPIVAAAARQIVTSITAAIAVRDPVMIVVRASAHPAAAHTTRERGFVKAIPKAMNSPIAKKDPAALRSPICGLQRRPSKISVIVV